MDVRQLNFLLALALLVIVLSVGCKKDKTLLSEIPLISLIDVYPDTVTQFIDSITFVIGFQDGDSDLGDADPDVYSLWIKDNRLITFDKYHLAPVAPNCVRVPVTGTIRVKYNNTILLGNGGIETTTYTIKIKDRAGNWSNILITDPITILP